MMNDYLEAERLGEADPDSCFSAYSGCPISLFSMMRTYSTPADKPLTHQHSKDPLENKPFGSEIAYHESDGIDENESTSSNHLRVDIF